MINEDILSKDPLMNIEEKEKIYRKIKDSICKIIINDNKEGYGFFCRIQDREKSNLVPVLITNSSFLSLEYIKTNTSLKILLIEGIEEKYISLDDTRINYCNEELNIIIIEIKPKVDEINSFLEIDENLYENENNDLVNLYKNIYIIERPHFKRDFISISPLEKMNNNTIEFKVNTAFGCIGTPIFNLDSHKIIGIHMNDIQSENNNNICFRNIINEFNKRNEINICMSLNHKAIKKNVYFLSPELESENSDEINKENLDLYINGKKEENFNFYFKPSKSGFYLIKIKIKKILKNCFKMFSKCKHISKIDLSSFDSKNITNMSYMFSDCSNLTNVNLTSLRAENVTDVSYIFSNCTNLANIDLSNFKTKNLINMKNMFSLCINLKNIIFDLFNTENVQNMSYMFYNCQNLTNLDLSFFDTKNVIYLNNVFDSCFELTELKLGKFNTSNCITMEKMFYDCQKLVNINNYLPFFDTKNIENMSGMFYNCKSFINLDISSFNTEKVLNMSRMFSNCKSLISVNLSNFITKNVLNMEQMFAYCYNLLELDLSKFNTENVINMNEMFSNCINLTKISLDSFNLKNIKSMRKTFYKCRSLIDLNLNFSLITKQVDFKDIFGDCYNLQNIDLSTLDYTKINDNNSCLFQNSANLTSIKVNLNSFTDFKYSHFNYNINK